MQNAPLPRITCNKCYKSQQWHGQTNCANCGLRLNTWSVQFQLRDAAGKPASTEPAQTNSRFDQR